MQQSSGVIKLTAVYFLRKSPFYGKNDKKTSIFIFFDYFSDPAFNFFSYIL